MSHIERTFCRVCHLNCSLFIEMKDGVPWKVYGDKDNPVYHGFSCIKGREMVALHTLPSRLLRPQKRDAHGAYHEVSYQQAITEIADKLKAILAAYGPRSIACWGGTPGANLVLPNAFAQAFLAAIESPMWFTPLTIDQPGKFLAKGLLGDWTAGTLPFDELDTQLVVGCNPLVSLGTGFGIASAYNLKRNIERGMTLIAIDPRRSETARKAHIHLQAKPGEDAAILAAIIHVVIEENLYDRAFVTAEASGLEALKKAVQPFAPGHVAERAGIDAGQLVAAARMYARGRKGGVNCGSGPNMSGRGMLVEYLGRVLMTLCGHWPRAGEKARHPGVFCDFGAAVAGTRGPYPAWGFGEKLRTRGFTNTLAGFPATALNDEILLPGEGRIRALIVVGGNPMAALPNQLKTAKAMKELDLLVTLDPQMSATARIAHYVIPPRLALENEAINVGMEMLTTAEMASGFGMEVPYGQYTPALLDVPAGSEVCDEWEFFYDVSRLLRRQLVVKPISILDPQEAMRLATPLDMEQRPTTEEIWSLLLKGSPVPLHEIKRDNRAGRIFDVPDRIVAEKPSDWTARLDIGNTLMMKELGEVATEDFEAKQGNRAFRLTVRRMREFHNSAWIDRGLARTKRSYNPASMHPDDMTQYGIASGDVIEIESELGVVLAIAESDASLRRGCLSLSQNWGANPDEDQDPLVMGTAVNRLIDDEREYDPYSGIPIMSALPIDVRKRNWNRKAI